ncbi:uncharacterized protein [Dysidea avara]|uniref:uncharacterized protein n=1 Tax=Dysidea avara TaxID=196820 RepID=UPI00331DF230
MVNCTIVGCSSDSSKPVRNICSFHKLPTIIMHQGPQMVEITTERRRVWLSVISRDNLPCLENVSVCSNHFESGKPAYVMKTFDVDWTPCINLGHDKVNVGTLQAASDRAIRTEQRRQRMEEAATSSSVASSSVGAQVSVEDTGCVFVNEGTQTDQGVLCHSKTVQMTTPPQTVMLGSRQMTGIFSMRRFFLSDDSKVHYYTGLTKCALLLSTFEFVMTPFCNGEKRAFYWR